MKIVKPNSPLEQKLQQVEHLMKQLGLTIHKGNYGLEIIHNGNFYSIVDLESNEGVNMLPRMSESDCLTIA